MTPMTSPHPGERTLAFDQKPRNPSDDLPACRHRGAGEFSHDADARSPVDQPDASLHQNLRQTPGCQGVLRPGTMV